MDAKIFETSNKGHIRRIYDKPLQLNSKKTKFHKRNGQRIQWILHKCRSMNCQLAHENVLSCTSHQGSANWNNFTTIRMTGNKTQATKFLTRIWSNEYYLLLMEVLNRTTTLEKICQFHIKLKYPYQKLSNLTPRYIPKGNKNMFIEILVHKCSQQLYS